MATEFATDWDEWRKEWGIWWINTPLDMARSRKSLPGRNMLADDIIGVYRINGQYVELSEVTFPNLSDRDPATGRLLEGRYRYIGITWLGENGACVNGGLAESFADLEAKLQSGRPEKGKDV